MITQRNAQVTKGDLESMLNEKFLAFEQELLKHLTDAFVVDNSKLDALVNTSEASVTWRDLMYEKLEEMRKSLEKMQQSLTEKEAA